MKVTEITVQVFNSKEEIEKILEKLNFTMYEKFQVTDYYFSKYNKEEAKNLPYEKLIKNSFLVRNPIKDKNYSFLCYKNKEIDKLGNVISEEKVICDIANLENALKIFELSNINCWCTLKQDVYCYKNEKMDIMVQIVADLGIFIEYEEDTSMSGLTEYEKIELMKNNLKQLGLNFGKDFSCKKVYMKFKNNV